MRPQSKLSLIASSLCTLFAATTVHASDYAMSPVQFPSSFNVNAMTQIGKVYDSPSNRQLTSARSAATTRPQTFLFAPSITRRKTNLAKFVEITRATDPASAAQMTALFTSTDIIAEMDRLMQQTYGMRANNLADAYAMWWTSAWNGAKGRNEDPSAGQMAMVKLQAANALASAPEFASATDAGKQEMAEAMLVQAAMIQGAIDVYKSDPAMLAKAKAAIAKGAKGMGLDLSTMTLTDEGFVPARKTGTAAPAPGTPEKALAANENTAPVTNSPPYLLMAAAGGAGIGGALLLGKAMGRRG